MYLEFLQAGMVQPAKPILIKTLMKAMRCLLGAILLSLLWVPGGLHPTVAAEGEAAIFIAPASSFLDLNGNNSVTLQVYVEDVVELNAVDITIVYDADLLTLSSWEHGGILRNLSEVIVEDEPGSLHLVYTQLATPGFTGSGVLLYLTFEGTNIGISPITLADVHLSNSDANTIPVEISHGSIAVVVYYTLQGSFGLEGQTNRGGVPVTLSDGQVFGGGPYSEKSQNQPGINLIVEDVIADTYMVTTTQPRCLNVTADLNKTITMTGDYTMQPLTLRCGNAIWTDNVIDVNDISIVGSQWGKSQADLPVGETLNGDVNFDNIVNIRDWALVAGNYDLSSEDVYTNWTP